MPFTIHHSSLSYMLLKHNAIAFVAKSPNFAVYRCRLLLPFTAAVYRCRLPLPFTAAVYRCRLPLPFTAAKMSDN
jgi:hypothetical protein